jgi:hypothetical protein
VQEELEMLYVLGLKKWKAFVVTTAIAHMLD